MSSEADLLRVLRIIAMTNEERMELFQKGAEVDGEAKWFLEHINKIAPKLWDRQWVRYQSFQSQRGCVVVTDGIGRMRTVEITELGRTAVLAGAVS